ncbi:tRNA 2-selenouridine(34) synthase MnmH [Algoriphagus sp. SE2]|uniref:tRNA 2-selenouridine(34) synthase MnmH n=1 Tax=Algoriphagus sp. SE2 TaxID=3141536 RepID=UPI0031CD399B
MNDKLISLEEFWTLRKQVPIIDARSEGEFLQSHIPNSYNLPILNNEERIIVGTLYKEKGSLEATIKGFELVGPRFHKIQKKAIRKFSTRKIIVYCWRGGMRSQILSWLLSMVGFEVYRLEGGYKTYRTFTFEEVRKDWKLILLGGKTGVGKTKLLQKLRESGEQTLDLEDLANHKGSAFGAIGQKPQPSVEQFENLMGEELRLKDPEKTIWVENESRRIGKIIINDQFFDLMSKSPLIDIRKSEEERIQLIEEEYSFLPKEELIAAVNRLKKKLGGLRTTEAIEDIINGNHRSWIANLLTYYDKTYQFDLEKRDPNSVKILDLTGIDLQKSCQFLLQTKNQLDGKLTNPTH